MGNAAKAEFMQKIVTNMTLADVFIVLSAINFIVFFKSWAWIPVFAGMTEAAFNAVLQQPQRVACGFCRWVAAAERRWSIGRRQNIALPPLALGYL